jgi:hypothetical protein
LSFCSAKILADDFASKNSSLTSVISSLPMASLPLILANKLAGVSSWTAYLKTNVSYVLHTYPRDKNNSRKPVGGSV